ncbi:hypothetical protein TNCV_514211 [Trichonephila clavipes]|nr:hypothetical protein TNCV_514211 [Trichonephila clavipes]
MGHCISQKRPDVLSSCLGSPEGEQDIVSELLIRRAVLLSPSTNAVQLNSCFSLKTLGRVCEGSRTLRTKGGELCGLVNDEVPESGEQRLEQLGLELKRFYSENL